MEFFAVLLWFGGAAAWIVALVVFIRLAGRVRSIESKLRDLRSSTDVMRWELRGIHETLRTAHGLPPVDQVRGDADVSS